MRYLLNSAVITSPGVWAYRLITPEEARQWLDAGGWVSTIGYPETAQALEMLTGIPIEVSRQTVRMQVGDQALVFRLTSRVPEVAQKGTFTAQWVLAHCELGILERKD